MKNVIPLEPMAMLPSKIVGLDPSIEQYQRYVVMDLCREKISFSSVEDMDQMNELTTKLNTLKSLQPFPANFFGKAIDISDILEPMRENLLETHTFLEDAINIYRISNTSLYYCLNHNLFREGKDW